MTLTLHGHLDVAPDVRAALDRGAPVVALETTIVTHGMPYPQNVATARRVEAIVREAGATPATIAVIDGRIRIGIDDAVLEALAGARDVLKLSRADLPYAIAARKTGATTVAATMICANLAGIAVFATGGVGGVHRGAEATFDVSADLEELARTPLTVVCAGVKALLDLPKTLELLETRGVPVVGYRTDDFPAFWSRSSGLRAPLRLDAPAEIAALIRAKAELGLVGGVLVTNPIPPDAEIPPAEIARYIDDAVAEAATRGISGKAVTPFILDRLYHTTAGRSLHANIALVENNAHLAAQIAAALAS
ncbi:MAG: Indigoidine synthase family protein [Candidatus Eremiobacteraeota bacterium]|nr:Indigoidine synthase family protein [Candidatus Eremiobacteraeota bacterium]